MYKSGNVTLMVSDFERAVTFYSQTLGLAMPQRYGNEWADITLKDMSIGLHPAGAETPQGGTSSIGLEVEDIDAAVETLSAKGVSFGEELRDNDAIRIIPFKDPDGYNLYLCQVK